MQLSNYEARVVFCYSTRHLAKKDKIRFFYALNGRPGEKGILQLTGSTRLGRSVLLVKKEFAKELEEFFSYWGCEYISKELWVEV